MSAFYQTEADGKRDCWRLKYSFDLFKFRKLDKIAHVQNFLFSLFLIFLSQLVEGTDFVIPVYRSL